MKVTIFDVQLSFLFRMKIALAAVYIKIVATAKEVGVLPPEAPQLPRNVPGVVPIMFRGMSGGFTDDGRRTTTTDDDDQSGLLRWGTPT
jgi:hypothetical protein